MEEVDFKRLLDGNSAETRAYFDAAVLRVENTMETIAAHLLRQFADLRGEFVVLREEFAVLREEFAELRGIVDANAEDARRQFAELRQELAELRQEVEANTTGLRHLGVLVEHLETKIQLLAETVALVDERLDREATDIRGEMRHGFTDTHALITFSYSTLDHRVTNLENR